MRKMGKCKGCGKLGRMMPRGGSVSAYQFSLLLSPVVSVWDCIVRKMRKVKKKQVKDELDRQKLAEKKKRRLEKALATSAAIISELEKKKQKKKEEQQRLDEEGAAIAEAVALRVLLGEEDSDETCEIVLNKDQVFNHWDCPGNIDVFMGGRRACFPYQDSAKYSLETIGWVSGAYRSGYNLGGLGNSEWSLSSGPYERDYPESFCDDGGWGTAGFAAGLIAAQAVSSLRIAEDAHEGTIVLDGMLRR
ncbi:hypothetical protein C1H46_032860 [Malus baccata]|uniref:Uncharacterized protein n=1 Tax=Malus baccata TaxID=106549 RepID=A0A540L5T4_MALBA|nr:hypothetical protein C1H46_032860 [Malus baccata]